MNKQREAMQFALETLEDIFGKHKIDVTAINMLRNALTEPEQESEPSAYVTGWHAGNLIIEPLNGWIPANGTVLYTTPPARKPLTVEQVEDEWERITGHSIFGGDRKEGRAMYLSPDEVMEFARAIERAHGIGEP